MGVKRMGKKKREILRAANANIFNDGFKMGYAMGYDQGQKDAADKANKNVLKWAHRGR